MWKFNLFIINIVKSFFLILKDIILFSWDFLFIKKTRKDRVSNWFKKMPIATDFYFLQAVIILGICSFIIYNYWNHILKNKTLFSIIFITSVCIIWYFAIKVVIKNKVKITKIKNIWLCPQCGSILEKKKNSKTYSYFYGCTKYSKTGCDYTCNISQKNNN